MDDVEQGDPTLADDAPPVDREGQAQHNVQGRGAKG